MLGVGAGVGFLSAGFVAIVWIGVTAVALPVAFSPWRTRRYAVAAGVALPIAVALGGTWPLALFLRAPLHLQAWWAAQSPGAFLAPFDPAAAGDVTFLPKNLPWFAWPALPFVLWTMWTRSRGFNGGLATPDLQLPATSRTGDPHRLAAMADPRLPHAMPLLVPLSLLASLEIDTLKRGFSGALDWFGILTFGLLSLLMWGLWFDSYTHGMSAEVARLFRDSETGYGPRFIGSAFSRRCS